MAIFHLLLLVAGQLAMLEDFSILDGIKERDVRDFPAFTPVRQPMAVLLSLLGFVAFMSLFLQKTDVLHSGLLFIKLPDTGQPLLDYFAMLMSCVAVVGGIPKTLLHINETHFTPLWGKSLSTCIYLVSSGFAFSVLFMLITQQRTVEALLGILKQPATTDKRKNEAIGFAMARATRSPDFAKRRFVDEAIHSEDAVYRERLNRVIVNSRAFMFVPEFLHHLHTRKSDADKLAGMRTILVLLDSGNPSADSDYVSLIQSKIVHQTTIRKAKHGDDVIKMLREIETLLRDDDQPLEQEQVQAQVQVQAPPKAVVVPAVKPSPAPAAPAAPAAVKLAVKVAPSPKPGVVAAVATGNLVTNVEQTAEVATRFVARGTISARIAKPAYNFTVTGHMDPHMAGVPQNMIVRMVKSPGAAKAEARVRARTGTNFNFNVGVVHMTKGGRLPAGDYEFAYEIEA